MNRLVTSSSWILLLAIGLAACGGPPAANPLLTEASQTYEAAERDTQIVAYAPVALDEAREALERSRQLWEDEADRAVVDHHAYIAQQRVHIAEQQARLKAAEKNLEVAEVQRKEVQLRARTAEAERAEREAQQAQARAEASEQEALLAKQAAEAALEQARAMAERIAELEAEQTERGLVLTLGDILFDVGKATLKAGGQRAVAELASFLQEYPERNVLIEGHTDNTGSDELNLTLSRQRADAVRLALAENGIDQARIHIRGYGEAYPVAGNESSAGRQQNRRVEVVISNKDGVFPVERDAQASVNQ